MKKMLGVMLAVSLCSLWLGCYAADAPEKGLIAYWSFDEGSGNTAKDMSGKGHNGTIYGAKYEKGKAGTCLSFDGVDNFVSVPDFADAPVSEITILVWQKTGEARAQSTLSNFPDDYKDRINFHIPWSDGTVYWDFGDITAEGRLSYIPDQEIVGTWQHFAFVASESENCMKIYRNGVEEASKDGMCPYSGAPRGIYIGLLDGANFFIGEIDELKMYNRALSAKEIKAQFSAAK
ncbi:hypothetical protein COY52_12005 [Candidatus Desantisbacteria bacterium CG_4_10_14_0_8_um_filter_48_22]|uniref:LamG-like jellyroll fold domain-containing protein n=1 Tax=Candidatus Desantisbacteria bacterium CG_4_10_14_0_8_um_filter_48_22 TaxID=1974543 RepID=A0A2M7S5E5_9BACT|nr:MAG: hypothetical protein AUJ67_01945 [Candidatus Desantisbacteria bacterium CG1_02_49_89]PIV54344.1 MAG: hypothetical protein COS16_10840 [Candidatus Desantisbacteria bacterium CG02_land_8_20_14_3_00_49_13]PIZ14568.1 MAG: hypothetical protein COY52_12005 [Candidatus Desantisbacteria bacterium CG_4_10_14_0_8_um_filter_48_22]PJB28489.1 MAG: hypothetical protein CO111_01505 [Candidatus Desantisbacteria bacterium CG_4_9_14_3_um_filter_50_7]